jgi:carbon-monoxide dehydrogenase small subunit
MPAPLTSSEHALHFELNGEARDATVPAHRRLIDLLRDDLGLTGTKEGCSVGVCGACSVLVDDQVVSACLMPAVFVDGARVTTIEGLAPDEAHLSPLQDAFIRHGGFQCGICTPGQIVTATALLAEHPHPSADQVRRWMMGNLCRCTGYYKIVESILAAAEMGAAPVPREAVGIRA